MFDSDISDGSIIGFASQLKLLVKALEVSSVAKFIEDFVSGLKSPLHNWCINYQVWIVVADCDILSATSAHVLFSLQMLDSNDVWWCSLFSNLIVVNSGSETLKSSAVVPPPTVLDRVLKDLFHEGTHLLFAVSLFNS